MTICVGPGRRSEEAWTSGSLLDPAQLEPLATLSRCFRAAHTRRLAFVLDSAVAALPVGPTLWLAGGPAPPAGLPEQLTAWLAAQAGDDTRPVTTGIVEFGSPRVRLFVGSASVPRELLLIGGGPDALPVVEFGATLGWRVTVADHRPAYADPARFPRARRVLLATPVELAQHVDLARFDAAVIMSHHIATDLAALAALAATPIPYVGLLGPASRRQLLLQDLGTATAAKFGARLHAPVGLELAGAIRRASHWRLPRRSRRICTARGTGRYSIATPRLEPARDAARCRQFVAFRFAEATADIAGRPMLARTLDTVSQLERRHAVTVVLGANAERLEPLVREAAANVAFNPDHAQALPLHSRRVDARAARCAWRLITLADQVAVTADDLRQLVSRWEQQPDRIVAAQYAGTIGVPAIFPAELFRELAELQGDRGARVVVSRHPERVIAVPMPPRRRTSTRRRTSRSALRPDPRASDGSIVPGRGHHHPVECNGSRLVQGGVIEGRHPVAQRLLHAAVTGLRSGVADSPSRWTLKCVRYTAPTSPRTRAEW